MTSTKTIQKIKEIPRREDDRCTEEEKKRIQVSLPERIKFVNSKDYKAFQAKLKKDLGLD